MRSEEVGFAPRQIWPPGAGLSSTTATRLPCSAAAHAAARPAGPAPTTSTSKRGSAGASAPGIGRDLHAVADDGLARPAVGDAVDRHAALEADAHAAQRAPGLAGHGSAEGRDACREER